MIFDIFLSILAGLLFRILLTALGISPEKIDSVRDRINYFVFYYIIPLVCFKTTYTMPLTLNHFKVSLVAILTILSCVAISSLIYRKIFSLTSEVIASFIICSSFGNVLYMGLPIITKFYGTEGMSYALIYDFLASTPLTWTVAVAVCMKYGKAKSIRISESLLTIIRIPPIWGLIIGFGFRNIDITVPDGVISFLSLISKVTTIFMLFIVGLSVKALTTKGFITSLPAILIKAFISPSLALLYGTLVGLSGISLNVCIIEAGMPSMLLSMVFATVFGIDMKTTIEMIFTTTVLSLTSLFIFSLFL